MRESCLNCHTPHGSNHDLLLVGARPFLCQQCHSPPLGASGRVLQREPDRGGGAAAGRKRRARASSDAPARTATRRSMAATIRRARASSADATRHERPFPTRTGSRTMRFVPAARPSPRGLGTRAGADRLAAGARRLRRRLRCRARERDDARPRSRGWGIALDPDEEPKRSPNGILYNRTPLPPEPRARTADGWEVSGDVEAGGSGSSGDTSDYFFQRYKDVGERRLPPLFRPHRRTGSDSELPRELRRRGRPHRPVLQPRVRPLQRLAGQRVLRRDPQRLLDDVPIAVERGRHRQRHAHPR